jgi:hypothetical protein
MVALGSSDHWDYVPHVGDPTLLGWTTTILYLLAAYFSHQVWKGMALRPSRSSRPSNDRRGWALTSAVMFVLGLNKQLDLQTTLQEVGIRLVVFLELYEYHRKVQVAVFLTAALVALGVGIATLPILLKAPPRLRIALLGVGIVASYIVLKAALIQKISARLGNSAIEWIEPAGVSLCLIAALSMRRVGQPRLQKIPP